MALTRIYGNLISSGTITGNVLTPYSVQSNALSNTSVTTGNYGGAQNIPVITVDASGRLTYAANVAIGASYVTANAIPTMLMLSGM
jgi:hypothetical protein